jgi:hypothetical protein
MVTYGLVYCLYVEGNKVNHVFNMIMSYNRT